MKTNVLKALPLLFLAACAGQAEQDKAMGEAHETQAAEPCKISGKIANGEEASAKLYFYPSLVEMKDSTLAELELDSSGTFSLETNFAEPTIAYLSSNKQNAVLYLEPGSSIEVNMDFANLETPVAYAGEAAPIHNYFMERNTLDAALERKHGQWYMTSLDTFLLILEEMKEEKTALLEQYIQQHPEDKDFFENERKDIKYALATKKINFPFYSKYYGDGVEVDSSSYFEFIKELDLNDHTSLNRRNYYYLVDALSGRYVDHVLETKGLQQYGPERAELEYAEIAKHFGKEVQDFLRYRLVFNQLRFEGVNPKTEKLFGQLKADVQNETYMASLDKLYKSWEPLMKGKKAPVFTAQNKDGEQFSSEDFAGKYLLVDVWASWCAPCKKEIPHLQALEAKYHDKNIVFANISVDERRDSWLRMAELKKLHEPMLWVDNAWESEIIKSYKIQGIPAFILIDPEGNIVTPRVPYPSTGEMEKLLDELL